MRGVYENLDKLKGLKLSRIWYREKDNAFLLWFMSPKNKNEIVCIELFNSFLCSLNGISNCIVSEVFFKKPGVFVHEYCNLNGLDPEIKFELRLMFVKTDAPDSEILPSLVIGCDDFEISFDIKSKFKFWEI